MMGVVYPTSSYSFMLARARGAAGIKAVHEKTPQTPMGINSKWSRDDVESPKARSRSTHK